MTTPSEEQDPRDTIRKALQAAKDDCKDILEDMPVEAHNGRQRALRAAHGNPREFAEKCIQSIGAITALNAISSSYEYRARWEEAGKRLELTEAHRCRILRRVLGVFMEGAESWQEDDIGTTLAYLAHAVVTPGGRVSFSPDGNEWTHATHELMKDLFAPDDIIWEFIDLEHP